MPDLGALLPKIEQAIYSPIHQLDVEAWVTPEPVPYSARQSGKHAVINIGQSWGKPWDCAWFHFTGQVPLSAAGKAVVLLIDLSGEACIVDVEGCPILGLTTVNSDFDFTLGRPGKRVVPLSDRAVGGEAVDLW